jgi:oligoendopeptidase F
MNNQTWNLGLLYSSLSDPKLKTDLEMAQRRADAFATNYKGKLSSLTPEAALVALDELYDISNLANRPVWFARLSFDLDTSNLESKALLDQLRGNQAKVLNATTFAWLELSNLPDDVFNRWSSDFILQEYKYSLSQDRKSKPFLRSELEEQILRQKNLTGTQAWVQLYGEICSNIKIPFTMDGTQQYLTVDQIRALRTRADRNIRRDATKALFLAFEEREHVLTYIFNTVYQDYKLENLDLRGYPHLLEKTVINDGITVEDVQMLFDATAKNVGVLQEFFTVKAKVLGISDFSSFDMLAPLEAVDDNVEFAKGKELVLEAFGRFDKELHDLSLDFFNGRIDVKSRAGKRGGAYCWGTNPNDPAFILLNYNDRLDDVFTLAHELGHGVHHELSRIQKPVNSGHTTSLAETASTFAEMLLADVLLETATPIQKRDILAGLLEKAAGTLFRQVQITQWELKAHEERARGVVSSQRYSEIWLETCKAMYGDAVQFTDGDAWAWASIPHTLNYRFYCYSYAFGMLLVLALYQQYKLEGANSFAPKYKRFLASGNKASPAELLGELGINTKDPSFWESGFAVVKDWLVQFKALV